MGNTSDSAFTVISNFVLNQIYGFQDANEVKANTKRLRDAFQRQHAWDDASVPTWAAAHDLGDHAGTIGVASGPGQTTYLGDGSQLSGLLTNATIKISNYSGTSATDRIIFSFGTAIYMAWIHLQASGGANHPRWLHIRADGSTGRVQWYSWTGAWAQAVGGTTSVRLTSTDLRVGASVAPICDAAGGNYWASAIGID